MRISLNNLLPNDVKIFSVLPVAQRFDSKISTSHREYSYFLPTYMLTPIKELLLESPPKKAAEDDGA
jgi:tRNA U38,U39,U40 pseudouridine synthase TruA